VITRFNRRKERVNMITGISHFYKISQCRHHLQLHTNATSLNHLYEPDALPGAKLAVSEHRTQSDADLLVH